MHAIWMRWSLVLGVAGVVIAATAVVATARASKGHKSDKYTARIAPRSYATARTEPASSANVCWRYYGGPKGGMWPGPCP